MKPLCPAAAVAAVMRAFGSQAVPERFTSRTTAHDFAARSAASGSGRAQVFCEGSADTGVALVYRPFDEFEIRAHGVGSGDNPERWIVILSIELPEVEGNGKSTNRHKRHNIWVVKGQYGLYANEDTPGISALKELAFVSEFLENPPKWFDWPASRRKAIRAAYSAFTASVAAPTRRIRILPDAVNVDIAA